jgi:hypothetical protein
VTPEELSNTLDLAAEALGKLAEGLEILEKLAKALEELVVGAASTNKQQFLQIAS